MVSKKHLLSVANITIEDFEKAKKGNDYMGDVFVIFKVVTKYGLFSTILRINLIQV